MQPVLKSLNCTIPFPERQYNYLNKKNQTKNLKLRINKNM